MSQTKNIIGLTMIDNEITCYYHVIDSFCLLPVVFFYSTSGEKQRQGHIREDVEAYG